MGEVRSETNRRIRVLLADDPTTFREELAGLLTNHEGLEVIEEVPTTKVP